MYSVQESVNLGNFSLCVASVFPWPRLPCLLSCFDADPKSTPSSVQF
jgi:hypothetical protein